MGNGKITIRGSPGRETSKKHQNMLSWFLLVTWANFKTLLGGLRQKDPLSERSS